MTLNSTPSIKRCSSALSTNGLCPRYSCSLSPTSASCWGRRLPLAVVNGEPPSHPHCLQVLSPMGALVRSGLCVRLLSPFCSHWRSLCCWSNSDLAWLMACCHRSTCCLEHYSSL